MMNIVYLVHKIVNRNLNNTALNAHRLCIIKMCIQL